MNFSHYTTKPVEMAVALVNTDGIKEDSLSTVEQMTSFLEEYRDLWEGAAKPAKTSDLKAIQELRSSLRDLIGSDDEHLAAKQVNVMLSDYGATPRVSTHSGEPHLHFEPLDSSMVSWLGAVTSMGLASVIVEHGVERFGMCCSDSCRDVYIDTSRNKSRRHCSNTCSTREAVAAYRARQSEDS